jgi:hypothetical protein
MVCNLNKTYTGTFDGSSVLLKRKGNHESTLHTGKAIYEKVLALAAKFSIPAVAYSYYLVFQNAQPKD